MPGEDDNSQRRRLYLTGAVTIVALLGAVFTLVAQPWREESREGEAVLGGLSLSDDAKVELLSTVVKMRAEFEWMGESERGLRSTSLAAPFDKRIRSEEGILAGLIEPAVVELEKAIEAVEVAELGKIAAEHQSTERREPDDAGAEPGGCETGRVGKFLWNNTPATTRVRRKLADLAASETRSRRAAVHLRWTEAQRPEAYARLQTDAFDIGGGYDSAYDYDYENEYQGGPPDRYAATRRIPSARLSLGPIGIAERNLRNAASETRGRSCKEVLSSIRRALPAVERSEKGTTVSVVRRSVQDLAELDTYRLVAAEDLRAQRELLQLKIGERSSLMQDQEFLFHQYLPTAIIVLAMLGLSLPVFSWVFSDQGREEGFRRGLLSYSTVVLLLVTITVLALGNLIKGEVLATLISGIAGYILAGQAGGRLAAGEPAGGSTPAPSPPPAAQSVASGGEPADAEGS